MGLFKGFTLKEHCIESKSSLTYTRTVSQGSKVVSLKVQRVNRRAMAYCMDNARCGLNLCQHDKALWYSHITILSILSCDPCDIMVARYILEIDITLPILNFFSVTAPQSRNTLWTF